MVIEVISIISNQISKSTGARMVFLTIVLIILLYDTFVQSWTLKYHLQIIFLPIWFGSTEFHCTTASLNFIVLDKANLIALSSQAVDRSYGGVDIKIGQWLLRFSCLNWYLQVTYW